jgi:hypothetical protein
MSSILDLNDFITVKLLEVPLLKRTKEMNNRNAGVKNTSL